MRGNATPSPRARGEGRGEGQPLSYLCTKPRRPLISSQSATAGSSIDLRHRLPRRGRSDAPALKPQPPALDGQHTAHTHLARETWRTPSPRLRGEGWGEGPRAHLIFARPAAPSSGLRHPSPRTRGEGMGRRSDAPAKGFMPRKPTRLNAGRPKNTDVAGQGTKLPLPALRGEGWDEGPRRSHIRDQGRRPLVRPSATFSPQAGRWDTAAKRRSTGDKPSTWACVDKVLEKRLPLLV